MAWVGSMAAIGLLATIGVALGCAVYSPGRTSRLYDITFANPPLDLDPTDRPLVADFQPMLEEDREWYANARWSYGDLRCFGYHRREFFPLAPIEFRTDVAKAGSGGYSAAVARTRAGWPFLALEGTETIRQNEWGHLVHEYRYAFPIPFEVDIGGPIALHRTIPLRPIWLGLVANTLMYGVAVASVVGGVSATRRLHRRARGCCVSCGYPISSRDCCPECGSPVKA